MHWPIHRSPLLCGTRVQGCPTQSTPDTQTNVVVNFWKANKVNNPTHLFSGFVKIETSCNEFVSLFGTLNEILPLVCHAINNIAERLPLRVA
jgi:hypothetical protein